jgi:hypothetical protein
VLRHQPTDHFRKEIPVLLLEHQHSGLDVRPEFTALPHFLEETKHMKVTGMRETLRRSQCVVRWTARNNGTALCKTIHTSWGGGPLSSWRYTAVGGLHRALCVDGNIRPVKSSVRGSVWTILHLSGHHLTEPHCSPLLLTCRRCSTADVGRSRLMPAVT